MPISTTVNTWQNTGARRQHKGEKQLLPGVGFPDGHLFLGQRGPLAERGICEIIAKFGQAAKLSSPLGPHDLCHTFAKSLFDPAAYGLDCPPMPLPAIQQLLGHANIATTTIYTRVSTDDLARMIGMSETL
jgi:integrase/recombinase XerD